MNDILRAAFYEEADDLFQQMEECLLEIDEQGVTNERIERLFRLMHTLKGSSSAMGIEDIAKITHYMEDILVLVRDLKLDFTKDLVSIMLQILDELKRKVNEHKNDNIYEIDVHSYVKTFENFKHKQIKEVEYTSKNGLIKDKFGSTGCEIRIFQISVFLKENSPLKGARLYIVTDKLKKSGQILKTSYDGIELEKINGEEFIISYASFLSINERLFV